MRKNLFFIAAILASQVSVSKIPQIEDSKTQAIALGGISGGGYTDEGGSVSGTNPYSYTGESENNNLALGPGIGGGLVGGGDSEGIVENGPSDSGGLMDAGDRKQFLAEGGVAAGGFAEPVLPVLT